MDSDTLRRETMARRCRSFTTRMTYTSPSPWIVVELRRRSSERGSMRRVLALVHLFELAVAGRVRTSLTSRSDRSATTQCPPEQRIHPYRPECAIQCLCSIEHELAPLTQHSTQSEYRMRRARIHFHRSLHSGRPQLARKRQRFSREQIVLGHREPSGRTPGEDLARCQVGRCLPILSFGVSLVSTVSMGQVHSPIPQHSGGRQPGRVEIIPSFTRQGGVIDDGYDEEHEDGLE